MKNKKYSEVERRLRAMIAELPVAFMPKEQPPKGSPDAIRWGRLRGRYSIWYQFKTVTGYRLFQYSTWLEESEAASAVLQTSKAYPQADLRYLEPEAVKAMLQEAQ